MRIMDEKGQNFTLSIIYGLFQKKSSRLRLRDCRRNFQVDRRACHCIRAVKLPNGPVRVLPEVGLTVKLGFPAASAEIVSTVAIKRLVYAKPAIGPVKGKVRDRTGTGVRICWRRVARVDDIAIEVVRQLFASGGAVGGIGNSGVGEVEADCGVVDGEMRGCGIYFLGLEGDVV